MIHLGNRIPQRLHRGSRKIHLLCKGGRPVYLSPEVRAGVLRDWLAANVTTTARPVADATAFWFELEMLLPAEFTGSPEEGWASPAHRGRLGVFWSDDLQNWAAAGEGWTSAPGAWPQLQLDGRNLWRARYAMPIWWQQVLVDYVATTARYGKSIQAITIAQTPVSLPGFPYAMPADAARLQADLRVSGYPGAVVSSVSRPISVSIRNHTPNNTEVMYATLVANEVVAVRYNGVMVPLSYPFAMPQQQATLQTSLRAAGYSGAVVSLLGSEWALFIPDRTAYGNIRDFKLTIDPGDPFPSWNFFGSYLGLIPDNEEVGNYTNLRDTGSAPLLEFTKAFARVGFI